MITKKKKMANDKKSKWEQKIEKRLDHISNQITFFEITEHSRKQTAKLSFSLIYILLAVLAFGVGMLIARVFFQG